MDPEFMEEFFKPMRDELTQAGYRELRTPAEVDQVMQEGADSTTLVMINSMCGCAGGVARPAAVEALRAPVKPDRFVTIFASQDREATARMREYFAEEPPSSPCFALLKNGKLVHMIPRSRIETRDARAVAEELEQTFKEHCG